MSSNIVLPTLTAWAENHIKAVVDANQDNVESALDAFLSKDATLTINGAKVTRQEFAQKVSESKFQVKSTTVNFTNTVEAVAEGKSTFEAGSVGVFYTGVITKSIRILGAPESTQFSVSLNILVEQDPSIPKPPSSPIHGFFDPRRVKAFNQIVVQSPVTPVLPDA